MENIDFIFGSLLYYGFTFGGLLLSTIVEINIPTWSLIFDKKSPPYDTPLLSETCSMSKVPVIRRRRASSIEISTNPQLCVKSNAAKTRRKSLPALSIQNKRMSMTTVDFTILGEAHGMITDLMADSSLPQNVISTLRIVADMISPLLQQGLHRQSFQNSLITVFEKTQNQEDEKQVMNQPDLKDDNPLSLKQRLQRNLGVNARRMSSTYTTTTSATGMPTIDTKYHSKSKSNSVSNSNKVSSRSKSYAGIMLRSPRERYRTLSNNKGVYVDEHYLNSNMDKYNSTDDDMFKIDINEGQPVYFDGLPNNDSEDEDISYSVNNTEELDEIKELSVSPSSKLINKHRVTILEEPLTDIVESHFKESEIADKLSKKDVVNKPSMTIDSPLPQLIETNSEGEDHIENTNTNNKKIEQTIAPPPPLAQRNINTKVAQISPVRKISVYEESHKDLLNNELAIVNNISNSNSSSNSNNSNNSNTSDNRSERRRSSHELYLEHEIAVSKNVDSILYKLNDWDFPIFELHEKSNVLTQVAYRIFQSCGFITTFKIPEVSLVRYFRALENGYHDIPYHNRIHAADVLHGVYYLTQQKIAGFNARNISYEDSPTNPESPIQMEDVIENDHPYGCMCNVMPDLELMALYTAAAMHDFDHPGRTNAFLVATLNPKALLYNDRSVLENHHAAAAWSLMVSNTGLNFLTNLDPADFKRFRFIVIEEILSTDLKKHFDLLAEWNGKISEQGVGLDFSLESDRLMVGQMAIKLADISGPSKEWTLHNRWTERIIEEFYQQGEDEKKFGMQMSAYMDRNDPKVPELQSSFIKHLVSPLYLAYEKAGILPGEWVDGDDSEDEENENNDLNSYEEEDEDENSSDENNSDKQEKPRKKIVYSLLLDNLEKNHEKWLKIIEEKDSANRQSDEECINENDVNEDDNSKD